MKLSKAIERVRDSLIHKTILLSQKDIEAQWLLIEAGNRFNSFSGYPHTSLGGPLPGETQE